MGRRIERASLVIQSLRELSHVDEDHLVRHLEEPHLHVEDAYRELYEGGYVVVAYRKVDRGDLRGFRREGMVSVSRCIRASGKQGGCNRDQLVRSYPNQPTRPEGQGRRPQV